MKISFACLCCRALIFALLALGIASCGPTPFLPAGSIHDETPSDVGKLFALRQATKADVSLQNFSDLTTTNSTVQTLPLGEQLSDSDRPPPNATTTTTADKTIYSLPPINSVNSPVQVPSSALFRNFVTAPSSSVSPNATQKNPPDQLQANSQNPPVITSAFLGDPRNGLKLRIGIQVLDDPEQILADSTLADYVHKHRDIQLVVPQAFAEDGSAIPDEELSSRTNVAVNFALYQFPFQTLKQKWTALHQHLDENLSSERRWKIVAITVTSQVGLHFIGLVGIAHTSITQYLGVVVPTFVLAGLWNYFGFEDFRLLESDPLTNRMSLSTRERFIEYTGAGLSRASRALLGYDINAPSEVIGKLLALPVMLAKGFATALIADGLVNNFLLSHAGIAGSSWTPDATLGFWGNLSTLLTASVVGSAVFTFADTFADMGLLSEQKVLKDDLEQNARAKRLTRVNFLERLQTVHFDIQALRVVKLSIADTLLSMAQSNVRHAADGFIALTAVSMLIYFKPAAFSKYFSRAWYVEKYEILRDTFAPTRPSAAPTFPVIRAGSREDREMSCAFSTEGH